MVSPPHYLQMETVGGRRRQSWRGKSLGTEMGYPQSWLALHCLHARHSNQRDPVMHQVWLKPDGSPPSSEEGADLQAELLVAFGTSHCSELSVSGVPSEATEIKALCISVFAASLMLLIVSRIYFGALTSYRRSSSLQQMGKTQMHQLSN